MTTIDISHATDKAFVVVGHVDAGKSTLIGTLTTGLLDDGRGFARTHVAKHKHEIDSGKTSDISTKTLKFPCGKTATLIDLCGHEKYFTTTASGISGMFPDYAIMVVSPSRGIHDVAKQHFKMLVSYNVPTFIVVTRVDCALSDSCDSVNREITSLCKLYKKKVEFLNGYKSYNNYVNGMTLAKKHSITKDIILDDIITEHDLHDSDIDALNEYFNFDVHKTSMVNEIIQGLQMSSGKQIYTPVLYISNVDGYCLDVIKNVIMTTHSRNLWNTDIDSNSVVKYLKNKLKIDDTVTNNLITPKHIGSTFYIDSVFNKNGIGLIISGINRGDPINVDDEVLLGPINKKFIRSKVKSLHNSNRESIQTLMNHHRGCIAIKPIKDVVKRDNIKKGMVVLSHSEMTKNICVTFEAAITIFDGHSATLRSGYAPVINMGTINQAAVMIIKINDEKIDFNSFMNRKKRKSDWNEFDTAHVKAGDAIRVYFTFCFRPEYVDIGSVFIFRSGTIHGIGYVINIIPFIQD